MLSNGDGINTRRTYATGAAISGDYKYAGAVASGGKVWFTPYNQNNVGVFDVAAGVFTTVATAGRVLHTLHHSLNSLTHSLTRVLARSDAR